MAQVDGAGAVGCLTYGKSYQLPAVIMLFVPGDRGCQFWRRSGFGGSFECELMARARWVIIGDGGRSDVVRVDGAGAAGCHC